MNDPIETMIAMIEQTKQLSKISSYEEINNHLYYFGEYVLIFQNKIDQMMVMFPEMIQDGMVVLPPNPTDNEIRGYTRIVLLEDIEMELVDLMCDLEEYKYLAEIVEEATISN